MGRNAKYVSGINVVDAQSRTHTHTQNRYGSLVVSLLVFHICIQSSTITAEHTTPSSTHLSIYLDTRSTKTNERSTRIESDGGGGGSRRLLGQIVGGTLSRSYIRAPSFMPVRADDDDARTPNVIVCVRRPAQATLWPYNVYIHMQTCISTNLYITLCVYIKSTQTWNNCTGTKISGFRTLWRCDHIDKTAHVTRIYFDQTLSARRVNTEKKQELCRSIR